MLRSPMSLVLTAGLVGVAGLGASHALGQVGTGFTYQGQLQTAGSPANGVHDLKFRLFDAGDGGEQVGSELCANDITVVDGRFSVILDFGGQFAGAQRHLEIDVRTDTGLDCTDQNGYDTLAPRQELTAVPNATFAQNAATADTAITATNATSLNGQSPSFYQDAANLTGTLADAQLSSNVALLNGDQTFTGLLNFTNAGNTFAGNGAGLTNLSGGNINAGTLARSSLSADVLSGVGTVGPDLSLAGSVATGGNPRSVAVSGSFAYVVNADSNTLRVFNISNPAAPTLAGSIATGNNPYSVAVSGSFAYVVNANSNTLQVFNISNPAAPMLAGSVATGGNPRSVAVSGSFAYVVNAESNTLQIFDISNPAASTPAGSVATGTNPFSVTVSGSFAYVVGLSNTLQVFNISNPAEPTLAGSVATESQPYSVAVSGSFVYLVNYFSSTMQIFDISNPAAPTLAGSVATESQPYSVSVSGSFAYVVNQDSNTLQRFNISNPAAPTLARSVATGNAPTSVAVSGSFVYLVNYFSSTMQVFNADTGVRFGTPLAASSLAGVNGAGLTGVNATQLNGQPASFYTNASNINSGTLASAQIPNLDTSKITTGTLANARTTGTNLNTPSTLVLRDASGNFSAGTITAALNGNAATATSATTATTATTATNATQLNGQGAAFYRDAANLNAGTIANARTTATSSNIVDRIVLRDGSGNFSAGTITANLTGTATTATTATNATNLGNNPPSFYTNASNLNAGTLPSVRLGGSYINAITLSNLGNSFTGNGAGLFNISAANLSGIIANASTTATASNIPSTIVLRDSVGNFTAGTITANLTGNATTATNATQLNGQAAAFYRDAANLNAGTIANARTTASTTNTANSIVLRDGSGNYTAPFANQATNASTAVLAVEASQLGTSADAYYRNASNMITGTLADARLTSNVPLKNVPNTFANNLTAPAFFGNGAGLTNLDAGDIASGNLAIGRMPTGGAWTLSSNLEVDGGTLVVDRTNNRVGIGLTNPSSPLHITAASLSGANGWMMRITNTFGGTGGLRMSDDGFLDATNSVTAGNFARLSSTGAWGTVSDRRIKKDIETAVGNLDAAMRLRPVTYGMVKEEAGSPRHLGFIAQEVREVIPEYVVGDETKTTLSVNYAQMSVVAIGAVQELKSENDQLQARIAALESIANRGGLTATQTAGLGAAIGLPLLGFAAIRRRKAAAAK
jgi:hypothetical protein